MSARPFAHEHWSSTVVFVLAAAGSAIGLGNIWRFPYLAGENGGGAFVLLYLACAVFVAVPILAGEIMTGRHGGQSPINTMRDIAVSNGASRRWGLGGLLAMGISFVVMTFYSVIAGWSLEFGLDAAIGRFRGLDQAGTTAIYDGLLANPWRQTLWHTVFMAANIFIVGHGLHRGIEVASKWMMPTLFALVIGLLAYALVVGDPVAGARFMLMPDFSRLKPETVLLATSQAFFSVTIGAGAMMTYGAYLPRHTSIPATTALIVLADTAVAVLAGLAIFAFVFAYDLKPAQGPGLVFVTLPIAFGQMPGGSIVGAAFFILLAMAALTSLIATLEPIVAYAEERWGINRWTTTIGVGGAAWLLGFGSVLSFNVLADFHPLAFIGAFADKTIFAASEYLSLTLLLPLSGLIVAVFAGWIVPRSVSVAQMGLGDGLRYRIWRVVVRWFGPLMVVAIYVYNL
ncbi:MAG: sodium-dependent transporter [Gammaproteobacteria bacterium]|nr:sodium-dependent transporter [Gammaproteobacteria bacterium]